MTISDAVAVMQNGGKVSRKGWGFLRTVLHLGPVNVKTGVTPIRLTNDDGVEKAYVPKHEDILANDWERRG